MRPSKTTLPDDVRAIIARSSFAGLGLILPEQLDRPTYVRVDKVLRSIGGKWDRKARAHTFAFDPRELVGDAVEDGAYVDRKKTLQFFETPDVLAERMVALAGLAPGDLALEPSAGMGRIARHLIGAGAQVEALDIDLTHCTALRNLSSPDRLRVWHQAFEDYAPDAPRFDAVVMNPPFSNGDDARHIRRAWDMLAPGGRLVAICCEGPFFREDKDSVAFREWLADIGADSEQLPDGTFQESGTGVRTRLVTATMPGSSSDQDAPVAEATVQVLPVNQIAPDPKQPRKIFDPAQLRDLAASLRADGLLQPITVRMVAPGQYWIVTGERRWRATQLNKAATIRALVIVTKDEADIRVKQIIENDQRVDVTPLEQARSYQALMDESNWTVEQLSQRIGKPVNRITDRTILLRLSAEYQQLLETGNLKISEAWEMVRLSPRGQDTLFRAIRSGRIRSTADLRTAASALLQAEEQGGFALGEPEPPTAAELNQVNAFEASIEKVAALLRSGIRENQVIAVRKINRGRAAHLADLMAAMQTDLRRIELSLREAAVQFDILSGTEGSRGAGGAA